MAYNYKERKGKNSESSEEENERNGKNGKNDKKGNIAVDKLNLLSKIQSEIHISRSFTSPRREMLKENV